MIVATSLDGHRPESKTVLNMVNRLKIETWDILTTFSKIIIEQSTKFD